MDIYSIIAIGLGLLASVTAVIAHLHLPIDHVRRYEEAAQSKIRELKHEIELLKAGRP